MPRPACPEHSFKVAGGINGLNGSLPRRVTTKKPKERHYAHFDDRLTPEQAVAYSIMPSEVIAHSFLPLIGYDKEVRRLDPEVFEINKNPHSEVFPPLYKTKIREIRYASHTDSAIYSFYADILNEKYEAYLQEYGLSPSVLAYRGGIGYNVPFAKSLIEEIKNRESCKVICLDISKFFDRIQHKLLKKNIASILGEDQLPPDWFKIFKSITNFAYVPKEQLDEMFGKVRGARICGIDAYRARVRSIIKENKKGYAIPQGTPLSGIFANICMTDFDLSMTRFSTSVGGSYRRYSDDIALVIPREHDHVSTLNIISGLLSEIGLQLNEGKTCITEFYLENRKQVAAGDQFQYLGFTFDGTRTLIRSQSIKNFYARMKSGIRRTIKFARKKNIPTNEIRKRVLIGKFTHWGDSRNFVQYAYKAARDLNSPEIEFQLRNHVQIFDRHWLKMIAATSQEAQHQASVSN
jgi:RNA-directed DNA polymerase